MKIVSPVYVNQSIKFDNSIIEFKNGSAEINDELFFKIKSSGFPNIYEDGQNPGVRTKPAADFDKTIKELNTEYMEEIDRLKRVNASKTQENKELKQQLENLKVAYAKDMQDLQRKLAQPASQQVKESQQVEAAVSEEDEVRKDLEAMKVVDLQKIAADQEGTDIEIFKKLTKKELIDRIMGKTE